MKTNVDSVYTQSSNHPRGLQLRHEAYAGPEAYLRLYGGIEEGGGFNVVPFDDG